MLTKTVEAQDVTLADLLSFAREGNEVIITEDDKPIARLSPVPEKRIAGLHEGQGWISEDFCATTSEDFWLGEE